MDVCISSSLVDALVGYVCAYAVSPRPLFKPSNKLARGLRCDVKWNTLQVSLGLGTAGKGKLEKAKKKWGDELVLDDVEYVCWM